MKILALEFSSDQRSAAAFDHATGVLSVATEAGGRQMKALALVETVLSEARLEREEIDCLAVGIGPGSYTGIRAAISLAQGWQLARPIHLLGISTVECLAAQAHAEQLRGRIAIVIDAQRNEFYLAVYGLEPDGPRLLEPLRLATFAEVETQAAAGATLVGPEAARCFRTGRTLFPDAATLAKLAVHRTDFVPGEKLELIYLRETAFVKAPPLREIPGL